MRAIRHAVVVLVGGGFVYPGAAGAHEKWFIDASSHPTSWGAALAPPGIASVTVALVLTVIAGVVWRALDRRNVIPGPEALGAEETSLTKFYAIVPLLLGVHVAIPLLVLGLRGELFSPNNQLPGAWVYWLGVVQIGVCLSFIYGGLTRLAAIALAAIWVTGIGVFGLEAMLENLHYLGFAAFFFLTGRGPYAIDRLLFPALEPSPDLARRAMVWLRVATGLGLAVVAFTEKLADPALAQAFLQHYPLNFTPWLGISMSDQLFVLCAGTTELFIGLCLAFGFFPRLIVATAWVFINMTLTVFNWVELVGHLPLYGVMGVLLVWTPTETEQRLWVRGVLGEGRSNRVRKTFAAPEPLAELARSAT